jgi:hypothetical protein
MIIQDYLILIDNILNFNLIIYPKKSPSLTDLRCVRQISTHELIPSASTISRNSPIDHPRLLPTCGVRFNRIVRLPHHRALPGSQIGLRSGHIMEVLGDPGIPNYQI